VNRENKTIKLRCISFPKGTKVVSVCLDLYLVAETSTLEDSKRKLIDAIVLYVSHAIDKNEIKELIPRKAPLKYFFKYYLIKLVTSIFKKAYTILNSNYRPDCYEFPVNSAEGTPLFG
jgi:hypothetical protein